MLHRLIVATLTLALLDVGANADSHDISTGAEIAQPQPATEIPSSAGPTSPSTTIESEI